MLIQWVAILLIGPPLVMCVDLKLVHEWRELEFAFPSRHLREYALQNGLYERGASLPIDVAVDYKGNL